jgi:hypothetical protein
MNRSAPDLLGPVVFLDFNLKDYSIPMMELIHHTRCQSVATRSYLCCCHHAQGKHRVAEQNC